MEPKNTDESAVFTTISNASEQSWLASLLTQIREYRNPPAPIQVTAEPDPEAVGLLIEQPSALGSMVSSIRGMIDDWRHPREYNVDPAEVEEIWGGRRYKTQIFSFVAYAALIGVVYAAPHVVKGSVSDEGTVIPITMMMPETLTIPKPTPPPPEILKPIPQRENKPAKVEGGGVPSARPAEVAPPPKPAPDTAGGGGGGGKNDDKPLSKGDLATFAKKQLVPPMLEALNENPVLVAPVTVVASNAPDFSFNMKSPSLLGSPTAPPDAPKSSGTGTGAGLGNGKGNGQGEGEGPGIGPGKNGGIGGGDTGVIANRVGPAGDGGNYGGARPIGGGIKAPVPIFQPRPGYSEDARKNKIQGQVLLELVVKADGTVDNIKVMRKLGYGLDESAVTTVRTWKFQPGTEDGKPVPVVLRMEVTFRLL